MLGWGIGVLLVTSMYNDAVANTRRTRLLECKSRDMPGTDRYIYEKSSKFTVVKQCSLITVFASF